MVDFIGMEPPATRWLPASRPWLIREMADLGKAYGAAPIPDAGGLKMTCTRCGVASDGDLLRRLWAWDGESRPDDPDVHRWTRGECLKPGCDANSVWVKFAETSSEWRAIFEGVAEDDALESEVDGNLSETEPRADFGNRGWRWLAPRLVIALGLIAVLGAVIRSTGAWTRTKSLLAPAEEFRASPESDPFGERR